MRSLLLLPSLLFFACGDGELDRDTVTNLPAGTAQGTWASGRYELTSVTTACEGQCPLIHSGLFSISTCDVGQSDRVYVEVVQSNGTLEMDGTGTGLYVERGKGGLDEDGHFVVGGYATLAAGDVEITSRLDGVLSKDGQLTGVSRTYGYGRVDEELIDCVGTYDVGGLRDGE